MALEQSDWIQSAQVASSADWKLFISLHASSRVLLRRSLGQFAINFLSSKMEKKESIGKNSWKSFINYKWYFSPTYSPKWQNVILRERAGVPVTT